MGFFSSIVDAARDANEEVHGARLIAEVRSSLDTLSRTNILVRETAIRGFVEGTALILPETLNWSRDGRIKIGRMMQSDARKTFDLDVSGSYSKWLGGAWLESEMRNSRDARDAFELLSNLLRLALSGNDADPAKALLCEYLRRHEPQQLRVEETPSAKRERIQRSVREDFVSWKPNETAEVRAISCFNCGTKLAAPVNQRVNVRCAVCKAEFEIST